MRTTTCLWALILFAFASCKKNGNGSSNCKITTVSMIPTGGSPTVVNFTYDNEGKLKFLNTGSQSVEHTYYPNAFKRRSSSGNGWSTVSFVELNAAGHPTVKKDSTYNGQILSQSHINTFEYNNNGELIATYKDNNPQPEETFTWNNGNLVKYKAGNVTYIMDYYTDKKNSDFGLIDLQIFVALGVNPAKSKNLLKSLTSGSDQLVFLYEFDSKKNIKEWNATLLGSPDTVIRTTQQFTCD